MTQSAISDVTIGAASEDAGLRIDLVNGPATVFARLADRLNPILVKETRQVLKGRQFLIAFLLMLFTGWLISLMTIAYQRSSIEFGDAGTELFASYYVVLAAAIVVVVPFGAFRSLITERQDATYEPLIITSLTPCQIVQGKFFSAMLQVFLFYSLMAPFIAFTALLQGFDITHVLLLLVLGLAISACVTMVSLAISSMVKGRFWQTAVTLAVLGALIPVFFMTAALPWEMRWLDLTDPWNLGGLFCFLLGGFTYIVLLQEVAVVNLTFEADNRSSRLRLISLIQIFLFWVGLFVWSGLILLNGFPTVGVEPVILVFFLSITQWTVLGLFFVTERDELSGRVRRRLRGPVLWRLLLALFYPGGSRGLLFILLMIGLLWLNCIAMLNLFPFALRYFSHFIYVATALCLYAVIYLNVAAFLSRVGMRSFPQLTPIHMRMISVIVIAFSMIVPMIPMAMSPYMNTDDHPLLYLPAMPMTMDLISSSRSTSSEIVTILIGLAVGACVMTLLNVRALLRSVWEIVFDQPGGSRAEWSGPVESVLSE